MVTLQNVLARSKKQEAQNVDRVQAPAEGQAGATRRCRRVGWGRIIGFTRYAAVFVMSRTKTATTIRKPASGPNLPGPVPTLAKTVAGNLIPPMALHSEIRLCRPHPR